MINSPLRWEWGLSNDGFTEEVPGAAGPLIETVLAAEVPLCLTHMLEVAHPSPASWGFPPWPRSEVPHPSSGAPVLTDKRGCSSEMPLPQ